jgi:hypothetical protein
MNVIGQVKVDVIELESGFSRRGILGVTGCSDCAEYYQADQQNQCRFAQVVRSHVSQLATK